jgi:hypothetical protein
MSRLGHLQSFNMSRLGHLQSFRTFAVVSESSNDWKTTTSRCISMLIQNMAFVVVFELHRTCSRSLSGCIGHGFLLVHPHSPGMHVVQPAISGRRVIGLESPNGIP